MESKKLTFYKYQGAGNDFVVFDNRDNSLPLHHPKLYQKLCNRRVGIGADGVLLLQKHPNYDFEMIYINADGYEGSMCGNGGRCIIAFAQKLGIVKENNNGTTHFLACDGEHYGKIEGEWIHLQMKDVQIDEIKKIGDDFDMDTGSPHYVQFVNNLKAINVLEAGKAIRHSPAYDEKGINVNFVEMQDAQDTQSMQSLHVSTFERGVEDVTWACGTGVVACSIAYFLQQNLNPGKHLTNIKTEGGDLKVSFDVEDNATHFKNIWLIGPAVLSFEGSIEIDL